MSNAELDEQTKRYHKALSATVAWNHDLMVSRNRALKRKRIAYESSVERSDLRLKRRKKQMARRLIDASCDLTKTVSLLPFEVKEMHSDSDDEHDLQFTTNHTSSSLTSVSGSQSPSKDPAAEIIDMCPVGFQRAFYDRRREQRAKLKAEALQKERLAARSAAEVPLFVAPPLSGGEGSKKKSLVSPASVTKRGNRSSRYLRAPKAVSKAKQAAPQSRKKSTIRKKTQQNAADAKQPTSESTNSSNDSSTANSSSGGSSSNSSSGSNSHSNSTDNSRSESAVPIKMEIEVCKSNSVLPPPAPVSGALSAVVNASPVPPVMAAPPSGFTISRRSSVSSLNVTVPPSNGATKLKSDTKVAPPVIPRKRKSTVKKESK